MALRLGEYIVRGELRNTQANSVYGWIEFAPDYGVHIELTGNLRGKLERKHIKFSAPSSNAPPKAWSEGSLPPEIESLADRQIGVVGDVLLRRVQVPTIPVEDFVKLEGSEQSKYSVEKDCLYLEWYSQNGRVVAEIIEPEIEFVEDSRADDTEPPEFEPLGDGYVGGIAEAYLENEEHGLLDEPEDESDDPYGLFDPNLERSVAESFGSELSFTDSEPLEMSDGEPAENVPRSWDEVIPGIDPETKAMYEQWDEIFEGKKDEPVAYLFETPLKLPPPDHVDSNDEANGLVTSILAQLALLSVAVDVCEHFTPLQTYRLLMTEILPTARVHPNLAASKMVQHYSTSDYCEACDEEFNAEFERETEDD